MNNNTVLPPIAIKTREEEWEEVQQIYHINNSGYGERLQAIAIILAEEEFVGQERVCDFIKFLSDEKGEQCYGIRIVPRRDLRVWAGSQVDS